MGSPPSRSPAWPRAAEWSRTTTALVAGLAADGVRDEPLQGPLVAQDYAIGKLDAASARAAARARTACQTAARPEHKISTSALADRYADQLPLRALVLPRVAPATGEPEPLEAGAVVRRVLASTLQQMPGRRAASVAALSALARALPAYELAVGSDLDTAVARIGRSHERPERRHPAL